MSKFKRDLLHQCPNRILFGRRFRQNNLLVYLGFIFGEMRLFRPNILFLPNFCFLKWLVSVFVVSVKNMFPSDSQRGQSTNLVRGRRGRQRRRVETRGGSCRSPDECRAPAAARMPPKSISCDPNELEVVNQMCVLKGAICNCKVTLNMINKGCSGTPTSLIP